MKKTQVNHIVKQVGHVTGGDAVDYIRQGKKLYFPDGFGMDALIYDDVTHMYYFVNFEGQLIGTNWNEGHIANRTWEVER